MIINQNKLIINTAEIADFEIKHYMHVDTGSVETEEEWVREIKEETNDLEEYFKEGTTAQEAFDEYCRDGKFVEVKKDIHGDWVEVR